MSRLAQLREKAAANEELYNMKVKRCTDELHRQLENNAVQLTIRKQLSNPQADINTVSQDIVKSVIDAATNPILEFEDVCAAKQYKKSEIRAIVNNGYRIWQLGSPDAEYEEMREKVAIYLQQNPNMYDFLNGLKTFDYNMK